MMNPYTFTRTGDTMQQLPGFHYAASLELNIGYYIIEISPKIWNLITIVTEFDKFVYNRVPMVLCDSSDILQAKVDYFIVYI